MDSRKIQTVGGGTYTVSLPKEWVEAQDIAAGDRVTLHPHIDGPLTVQPPSAAGEAPESVTVPVADEDPALLERTVRAAYVAGGSEVRFEAPGGFTLAQRRALDRAARILPGVSVVETGETTVRVRTLLDAEEMSVRQSVRQLSFVTLSEYRDAIAALTGDADAAAPAAGGGHADRLAAMVDRAFARALARLDEADALGVTRPELFDLWATTRELERVAGHAEALGSATAALDAVPESTAADVVAVAREARGVVADAVSAVVGDAGFETAQETLLARDDVCAAVDALGEDRAGATDGEDRAGATDGEDRAGATDGQGGIAPVLHTVRWTADRGGAIAEVGLRKAIREGKTPSAPGERAPDGDADPETGASAGE